MDQDNTRSGGASRKSSPPVQQTPSGNHPLASTSQARKLTSKDSSDASEEPPLDEIVCASTLRSMAPASPEVSTVGSDSGEIRKTADSHNAGQSHPASQSLVEPKSPPENDSTIVGITKQAGNEETTGTSNVKDPYDVPDESFGKDRPARR